MAETAIVWVPGHLCGASLYAPQIAAFGGTVADTTADDDLGAMAERLLAAAPARFVVAGLSMGGMVAMEAMARAPGRIAGAVLMDTDPTAARPREIAWRDGERADLRANGPAGYVGRFVARFFAHDPEAAARLGPATLAAALATPPAAILAQMHALDTRREMAPLLAGMAAPVEVVVGAQDRLCPPQLHAPLAAALPGAVLTELPGCGHIATLEAPAAVNARVAALLARAGG